MIEFIFIYKLINKNYFDIFHHKSYIFFELLYCDEILRTMLVYDKEKIYRIVLKHVYDQMIHHYRMMIFIEWIICHMGWLSS